MGFLLDTNVISELRKADRCSRSVRRWHNKTPEEDMFLSVVVFGELRSGVENLRSRDPVASRHLEQWMLGLPLFYEDRILPVTLEICDQWGYFLAEQNVPPADGLMAATAHFHDHTVVTRNVKHFQRVGIDYFNPFED